jgi:type IV pilus assembly protein PilP
MKYYWKTLFIFMLIIISGCTPEVSENVVAYVESVKNKKNVYKEDLPKFPKSKNIKYTANKLRDPFSAYSIRSSDKSPAGGPDLNRKREALEAYPLDTLTMIGTIEQDSKFFALLKDGTGIVHIAGVGNYIGQNAGKIEKITPTEVNVKQWVSDNKGGWREFPVTLFLNTTTTKTTKDQNAKSSKK